MRVLSLPGQHWCHLGYYLVTTLQAGTKRLLRPQRAHFMRLIYAQASGNYLCIVLSWQYKMAAHVLLMLLLLLQLVHCVLFCRQIVLLL